MADILRAVKGMNDILPASVPRTDRLPDSALWSWFETTVREVLSRYGYQYLVTPVVEPTALFVRGLGEVTDIVEKEMYSFVDAMNGDRLTLRPEATAGIVAGSSPTRSQKLSTVDAEVNVIASTWPARRAARSF